MKDREVVLDQPVVIDEQAEALRQAQERAERAEAELAKLKAGGAAKSSAHKASGEETPKAAAAESRAATKDRSHGGTKSKGQPAKAKKSHAAADETRSSAGAALSSEEASLKTPPSPNTVANAVPRDEESEPGQPEGGVEELRKDSMMAHLLDSLEAGKDIGHYGRLVFAMVARHFLPHDEVLAWMTKDRDVSEEKALLMLRQVEGKDYSPPKRDKILEYQAQQDFPILPEPEDPDCGNLYRNLKFPNEIYEHISHYQEAKLES